MNNHLEETLIKNHPTLYGNNDKPELANLCFECDDGWFPIIDTLSKLIVECSAAVRVVCVQKKQARLVLNVVDSPPDDEEYISGVIKMGAILSEIACETCSSRGEMFNDNSMAARCFNHGAKRLPFFKRMTDSVALPFANKGIGYMQRTMIAKLFEEVNEADNNKIMPKVEFTRAWIATNNELCIEYSGGNKVTEGMVTTLLEYSKLIDENTGAIKNLGFLDKNTI